MLLVLGRPGSGCSTFLKVIGNQRSGYEAVEGDVLYGGTNSKTMADKYRSEGMLLKTDPTTKLTDLLVSQCFTTPKMIFIMQP